MGTKSTGYGLLALGILIMIFSVVQVFLLFTNQIKPPTLFTENNTQNQTINPSGLANPQGTGGINFSAIIDQAIGPKLNQALNMGTYFFLMTFLGGFGYKIASLGIQLIRPIVVKLKGMEQHVDNVSS